ncbi:8758_t:CDS:2 [Gigaspora margarita]|uniref:8758_t:CDS:1 n=1 Tax=Gigaspora margarita TaxID=4874 RepID=A0ABN7VJ83_GIGMA|nr:8758_t:CDS:2 [Gigaspora margarita]
MPPKKMTPYQFSRGLTYDAPTPPFLRGITQPSEEAKLENEDDNSESSDELEEINAKREEERPQIVVLKEGKHLSEKEVKKILETREKNTAEESLSEEEEIQEDSPAVDEKTGKLLFRQPKKKDIAEPVTNNKLDNVVGSSKAKTSKSDTSIKAVNEVIEGMKRKRNSKNETNTSVSTDKKPKHKKAKKTLLSFDEEGG